MNDRVNTTKRVQVSVRPFLAPLLELAEARMAAKQADGYTMEHMTARVLSGRLYSKAIDFDERLDYRERAGMSQADKAIVTPEAELTAKLADVVNLAGLTALAFTNEVKQECKSAQGGIVKATACGTESGAEVILPLPITSEPMREAAEALATPSKAEPGMVRRLGLLQQGDLTLDGQKRLAADLWMLIPSPPTEAEQRTYPDTVLGDIDAGDAS